MFAKDVVYKLDENIYQEFLTRLMTRHSLASSSLETFGYPDLRPPVWAIDTRKGLTANDFEMCALQYCIRIEHFLYMLDDVHDWDREPILENKNTTFLLFLLHYIPSQRPLITTRPPTGAWGEYQVSLQEKRNSTIKRTEF
ncbi:hypothetical protein EDD85DRAFT_943771 [Armillaria nabsnona]|nr:hypothetical protein EDD85DRAFT_943771 [Armillaria nabsnona]